MIDCFDRKLCVMKEYIKNMIRNIPHFPKEGIQFKDITPVLADPKALDVVIEWFAQSISAVASVEKIIGVESRGFIFAAAIANRMGVGFVPIRKPGKLPHSTFQIEYDLEYGKDSLEIHTDALRSGEKVALIDDLLATGGTACAAAQLIAQAGGDLQVSSFLIELDFLEGRKTMEKVQSGIVDSMVHF